MPPAGLRVSHFSRIKKREHLNTDIIFSPQKSFLFLKPSSPINEEGYLEDCVSTLIYSDVRMRDSKLFSDFNVRRFGI